MGVSLKTQGYSQPSRWGTCRMPCACKMDLRKSRSSLTQSQDAQISAEFQASRFTAADSRPSLVLKPLCTKYPKDGKIIWFNLRQEPDVYVNGEPICARPAN